MTEDRIIHGIFGVIFALPVLFARRRNLSAIHMVGLVGFALVGSWVPDWDLFFGVGAHRSPFTHSVLPAVLLYFLASPHRMPSAISGFSVGIASHLVLDTFNYGNVVGIPGGTADRLFLMGNAAAALILSAMAHRARRPAQIGAAVSGSDSDGEVASPHEIEAPKRKKYLRKRMTRTQIFFAKHNMFFAQLRASLMTVLIAVAILILIVFGDLL